ncbi:TLC domain-containing protein, partial [Shewanella sp. C32]
LGCIALYRRPYRHCILWAAGCGEDFRQAPACLLTGLEKVYFMLFIAYYLVDIGFLWTNPDWVVFFCHHVITVMMVSFCLILNVQVVGM